jgi:hypothetical protein
MTTFATDKSYANTVNSAPHPAAYCQTVVPSGTITLRRPSRWLMISDLTAKAVQLVLAGAVRATPAALVAVAGDISAAVGGVYNSTTGGKFSTLNVNDTVVIKGFANANNNGQFQVKAATGTSITVTAFGSTLAPGTIAETPAGTAVTIQGPDTQTPDGVTLTLNPGVMYPICAAQIIAAGTTAASVLAFY